MKYGQTFYKAKFEAFQNESIMPIDCLNLLEKHYGKRLDSIKPKVICAMIEEMMRTSVDYDISAEVNEVVQEFCNTF